MKYSTLFGLIAVILNFVCWYGIYDVGASIINGSPLSNNKKSVSAPAVPEKQKTATVKPDALNMREGPSTENPVVVTLHKGNIVTVLEKKEGSSWLKVEYNEKIGYVHGDYIAIEEEN